VYGWTPRIGEHSLLGWLTIGAYAAAAILCALASRSRVTGTERHIWIGLALFGAFLCMNKQLDLQSLGTAVARSLAKEQGWYEERRTYQEAFIGFLAASAFLALVLSVAARGYSIALRAGLIGAILLGTFILIRASSFHHIEWFLAVALGGVRMNHVLELVGIAILCLAAAGRLRK
jgi:hypothetical protein